jgi:hypothetical protein
MAFDLIFSVLSSSKDNTGVNASNQAIIAALSCVGRGRAEGISPLAFGVA